MKCEAASTGRSSNQGSRKREEPLGSGEEQRIGYEVRGGKQGGWGRIFPHFWVK
jgi:hypothetical protein